MLLEMGCSFEGIVVGSAAALLMEGDLGHEFKGDGSSPLELLFPLFPDYLGAAICQMSESLHLDADWLRAGPPTVNTIFSCGTEIPLELPDGWQKRVQPLVFYGDALHLHAPGRCELIALEVAEAAWGQARPEVLGLLSPSEQELRWAHEWLRELANT
ncbi:MAG: hypothetical protein JRH20_02510 [Deltaproteobacteria bacterium]|nr:hypothetical protein [Deltaproteobacteria bacterium]